MTNLICIVCPRGCRLSVDEENDFAVTGNTCPRGAAYGKSEIQNPVRVVTSTVKITGARQNRCPVKTNGSVPKGMVADIMKALDGVTLASPVSIGDTAVENALGTGVDIVVTKNL